MRVGRELISKVTDGVMDDVRAWTARPLEDVYPVIFLDALQPKIREGGSVQRRACYLALGITLAGERDVLGLWLQATEGATVRIIATRANARPDWAPSSAGQSSDSRD